MIALDTARQANHPHGTDLTVDILIMMDDQALHLGRPDEALRLVQLGAVTATNGTYPVSASVRGENAMDLAYCRASLGDVDPCRRALDQALQTYADADPASAPPWSRHVGAAHVAAQHGRTMFLLSRTDPGYAPAAIERLHAAVDGFGPTHGHRRALTISRLASSYFLAGELDSAVRTGHEAVTTISALSSKLAIAGLRTLADIAEPHKHRSDVTELRQQIRTALAAAA